MSKEEKKIIEQIEKLALPQLTDQQHLQLRRQTITKLQEEKKSNLIDKLLKQFYLPQLVPVAAMLLVAFSIFFSSGKFFWQEQQQISNDQLARLLNQDLSTILEPLPYAEADYQDIENYLTTEEALQAAGFSLEEETTTEEEYISETPYPLIEDEISENLNNKKLTSFRRIT